MFIRRGWKAILIEPHPVVFQELKNLHEGNPNVTCLDLACGERESSARLFFGSDSDCAEFSTLNTEDTPYFRRTRTEEYAEVTVEKLSNILEQCECPKEVDLLSVDAETYDLEVLKGMDFAKFAPKWIITENYKPKDPEKYSLLARAGYVLKRKSGVNTLWMKQT